MAGTAASNLALVRQFLTHLEQDKILRLAWSMEENTVSHIHQVPSEVILGMLRPQLAALHPNRYPKMRRAICVPFEDLLHSDDSLKRAPGTVARALVTAMWAFLEDGAASPELIATENAFRKAREDADREKMLLLAPSLWRGVADSLLAALDKATRGNSEMALARKLGGQTRLQDLSEMAAVLDIAEDIEELKAALPEKPIRALTTAMVQTVIATCQAVAKANPARVQSVLAVLFARLQRPRDILRLTTALAGLRLPDAQGNARLDDLMLGALDTTAQQINAAESGHEDDLMRLVLCYADTLGGLSIAADQRKQGGEALRRRMQESRDKIKQVVVDAVLKSAPETLLNALPGQPVPGKNPPRPGAPIPIEPDLTREPSDEAFEAAERRASAVGQFARVAEIMGAAAVTQKAVGGMSEQLEDYVGRCIRRLHNLTPEEAPDAAPHLMFGVRLLELVGGTDRADRLRRQAMSILEGAL